jgi:tripartite-type tricarboxylate transporter receptor subunit TctC
MSLFPKAQLKYDLLTDLAPVSMIMTGPLVLVTRPDFPANNLKELVAAAKAKPGTLSFASSGNGSSTHLGGEMLNAAAGMQPIHVPYKGSGPGLTDVMGGQTTYMLDTMLSATPFVTSGSSRHWPSPARSVRLFCPTFPPWRNRVTPTSKRSPSSA